MSLRVKFVNSKLEYKTCFKCKESFPRDEDHFYKVKHRTTKGSFKYGSYCIACERKRNQEWKKKDSASGNKKKDNVNIYLRRMDTLENYGKAVKNLLMVVCLNLMKSFLNVGYNKKKFMAPNVLIVV
jgi:hypothetical protein